MPSSHTLIGNTSNIGLSDLIWTSPFSSTNPNSSNNSLNVNLQIGHP